MISDRAARLWQFAAVVFLACCAIAPYSLANPFPATKSDLPQDPAIVSGQLDNGMRFAIRRNAEPRNRVTLRLVVAAGSLVEEESERGLAHFVEHMAFRGSRDHPGEELANMLQREGFAFGPDNTAFTLYDHTIYHLEMPRADEETLRKALGVFKAYASELTFEPDLIERERGVILNEKAMRDTADTRNQQFNTDLLFPNTHLSRRAVIGTEDTIRAVKREDFVRFYDKWYRPDRLAIVAVGDMDPALIKRVLSELFEPLRPRSPEPTEPAELFPSKSGVPSVRIHRDPGSLGVVIAMQHPVMNPSALEDRAQRVRNLARSVAFAAFERRLARISRTVGDTLVAPSVQTGESIANWQVAWLSAATRVDNWRALARTMEQEHRRAYTHGFTAGEIDPIRRQFIEALDSGVRAASTRDSRMLASQMVSSILYGFPVITPELSASEYTDALVNLTPKVCLEAFREAWGPGPYHVSIMCHSAFVADATEVGRVLNVSRSVAVAPFVEAPAPEFAYQTFGRAGDLISESEVPDLAVHQAAFANGVKLNFKHTDFDRDSVSICVRVNGGGKLSLKRKQAGLDWFAQWAFVAGGLGRHDPADMQDILAGRSIGGWFNVDTDALLLTGRCAKRDLQLLFKLLTAQLIDPGYRTSAIPIAKASFGSMIAEVAASPGGPIRVSMNQILMSDDPRFATPITENFSNQSLLDLRKWLTPHLQKDPVEIAVVGDARWEDVKAIASRTFGALAPRGETPAAVKTPSLAKPTGQPFYMQASPSLRQAAFAFVYPMPDCTSTWQERRAHLLANQLSECARQTLREELGSSYFMTASFIEDPALPGLNRLVIYAEVDAGQLHNARERLERELSERARSGFTDDEFARVKAPFVHTYRDEMRENNYWLFTVLSQAQSRPGKLDAARTRMADVESITREDIEALMRRYIDKDRAFQFVAVPATAGNAPGF